MKRDFATASAKDVDLAIVLLIFLNNLLLPSDSFHINNGILFLVIPCYCLVRSRDKQSCVYAIVRRLKTGFRFIHVIYFAFGSTRHSLST